MVEENQTQVQDEATEAVEVEVVESVKPVKEKKRKPEELADVSPAKMSNAERVAYIKYCREQMTLLMNKNKELEVTCQKAFTMFKQANSDYGKLKANVDVCMRDLELQVLCFQNNIKRLCHSGVVVE